MEEMISVNNLRKEFSYYKKGAGLQGSLNNLFHRQMLTKEAVKDVSFSVEKGEMMALLGPNGAGKTTTLKLLSGILYPTSGEVLVNGFVPWERKNEFKRSFAIVMGQKNQLWWDLPASDSLYLNKCIYDVDDREYKKTVDELHRPGILFLDEPTIGLDIVSQQKIRDFLHYYNEQTKTTIILTSHYMRDIEALCSRAVIINSGTLVYDGALSDINHRMGDKRLLTLSFSSPVETGKLSIFGRVRENKDLTAVLEIPKERIKETASQMLSLFPVDDFTVTEVPLEESIARIFTGEVAG